MEFILYFGLRDGDRAVVTGGGEGVGVRKGHRQNICNKQENVREALEKGVVTLATASLFLFHVLNANRAVVTGGGEGVMGGKGNQEKICSKTTNRIFMREARNGRGYASDSSVVSMI